MLHFVRQYRWWYLLILVLEVAGAVSATLMPYVIGQVVKTVTQLRASPELNYAFGIVIPRWRMYLPALSA